ncbi:MAG: undecaprenyl-diphosphate phosphatase [Holosporaceae bacterium]|jgi:undecaprenyl-diphosphatase|nr:undecaprenyl-diphosphate phosphatase [Holosporaceae bacterium]
MTFFQAFCLGVIQGITEFLPVSSSAHVDIFSKLMNLPHQDKAFNIFLNIGSLLAVVVFFRRQVAAMFWGGVDFIRNKKTDDRLFFVTILLANLPTITVFGALEIVFQVEINSAIVLAASMILFAVILYLCDRNPTDKENASRKDILLVGLVQPLSFISGVSRLGICMSMMRYLRYSREESFRYSMVLSIPSVLGACGVKLIKALIGQSIIENWSMVAVGCLSAFVFGILSLYGVIRFLRNHTLLPIVIYRILLGLFVMASQTSFVFSFLG